MAKARLVTIEGPAGAGKGTVARLLAERSDQVPGTLGAPKAMLIEDRSEKATDRKKH